MSGKGLLPTALLNIETVPSDQLATGRQGRIVCRTVREIGPRPGVPGAIRVRCCECRAELWMSPSTRKIMVAGWQPICVGCAGAYTGPVSGIYTTPEINRELADRIDREQAATGHAFIPALEADLVLSLDLRQRMS